MSGKLGPIDLADVDKISFDCASVFSVPLIDLLIARIGSPSRVHTKLGSATSFRPYFAKGFGIAAENLPKPSKLV